MAQSGFTPIQLYRTATASAAPSAGNLADGELAINTNDGLLFYKDSGGVVRTLASSASTSGVFAPGTVSAPGITFTGDTNTGIYSPAADTIAFTEGGVEAMRLDATGNVGIGTTAPTARLNIVDNTSQDALRITQTGSGNALVVEDTANPDSTPFAVTTTGNVVVGSTALQATAVGNPSLQIFGGTSPLSMVRSAASSTPINLEFAKARGGDLPGTALISGDTIGRLYFSGSDGTAMLPAAFIDAAVDGTPGTNDMPGRLVFSTTADGASSPTERMRIDNLGRVGIGSLGAFGNSALGIRSSLAGAGVANYGVRVAMVADPAATSSIFGFSTASMQGGAGASPYITANLYHYRADPFTLGANQTVTNQFGFEATSGLTNATNNFGVYSNIAAGTTRTITNVARTTNVVTITTSAAHGYAEGQSVTVAATTNTGVNGTFTIASTPTTTTFTYAQVGADIPSAVDTGSTVVVGRWNFYANGTAPNRFAGYTGIGIEPSVTDSGVLLQVRPSSSGRTWAANTNLDVLTESSGIAGVHIISGNTSQGRLWFSDTDAEVRGAVTYDHSTDAMLLSTAGPERMRIDASGNVGIGTSSPAYPADIQGNSAAIGWNIRGRAADGISVGRFANNSNTETVRLIAYNDSTFAISNTASTVERMRIDASGNVGIGTSSPGVRFHVNSGAADEVARFEGTGSPFITLFDTNVRQFYLSAVANSVDMVVEPSKALTFGTNNAERMRISPAGNVGIGTNSPASLLDVNGAIRDSKGDVRSIPQNAQGGAYTLVAADAGRHISITTGGVTVPASVFSVGDAVTIFNNSGSNQTITQGGSVTLRQAGTANTGNRTLAQYGVCTILCVASNTFVISGAGLT